EAAESGLGFTDFAQTWLGEIVAQVTGMTGRRPALFGICQGGVFALCHGAHHPEAVAGLALTGTPVDFHADLSAREGALNRLARSLPRDVIEELMAPRNLLPGALIGALFQAITPGRTFVKYSLGLSELAHDPDGLERFMAMEAWLADRPNHPSVATREWLVELYQKNALIAGAFRVADRPVALGEITCPVLNIIGRRDHIVPPECSRALETHLRPGLYRSVETETGHIGVMVSRRGKDRVAEALATWLKDLPA
ncbi:MAG: alpha/beta fold hydrolase, partial [Pseudomonadota bacterium]